MTQTIDIGTATHAYMTAALWTSIDDNGEPLDGLYGVDDITAGSQHYMLADVTAFIEGCLEWRPEIFDGIDDAQIGHDFWLTRNRHGAGFWDRGLGEVGDWLTAMAKPYGEADLYIGDDGWVHYSN